MTGNIAVIVPAAAGGYRIWNATSGSFTLTVKTASGTGVAVPQNSTVQLWCEATNVVAATETALIDSSGNELVKSTATASAVNELTVRNAATANAPAILASGDDTNISINLVPKGTGTLQVNGKSVATVLLATATASGSAAIDFTSGINSTYDEYFIVVTDLVPATDNTDLWLRVTEDGASFKSGASDYGWSRISSIEGAAPGSAGAASDTKINLVGGIGNSTGEAVSARINFRAPSGSKYKSFEATTGYYNSTPSTVLSAAAGIYKGTTNAILGVRLMMSAGTVTSGSFALYGVVKS